MPSHRQSVTLPVPLYEFLKEAAKLKGVTVSDMIRKILDEHLEATERAEIKREEKYARV
jgi:predicted DNA-binding ribbon-helix-helix protein